MATRQIKVVISVQDAASKKMNQVERTMRKTGKAADGASKRFMHFNRTLFTTTAFIGTFVAAFRGLNNVINQGADFNRLENAFKDIFGPNADVLKMVKGFTDTAVDEIDAMRASIRLSSKDLGLGQAEVGELLARGAVAAKRAGQTAAEGAKAIAEAIRTGNIEAADNLNIINKGGVAYKAYEAAIAKASGTMSPAIKIMYRKNLILQALRESTEGYMRGNRDLKDVLVTASNSTRRLTKNLGLLLGRALGPLIDSLSKVTNKAAGAIKELAQNKKFIETAKYITLATGAVIGLAGALGTLKLATIALGSFATGFPGLMVLLASGAALFAGLTTKAEGLNAKFQTLVGFFKGTWQLVSRFDEGTGFSTMNKEIADLMVKMGLMTKTIKDGRTVYDGLLVNVARGAVLVKKFVQGMAEGIKSAFNVAINMFNTIADKIKVILNLKSGPWAKSWLGDAQNLGKAFGVLSTVVGGLMALKGIKSVIGGLIPSFGKSKGPKGTAMDPIHTVSAGGALGALGARSGKGIGRMFRVWGRYGRMLLKSAFIVPIASLVGKLAGMFLRTGIGRILSNIVFRLGFFKDALAVIPKMLGRLAIRLPLLVAKFAPVVVALGAAATAGWMLGKAFTELVPQVKNLGSWLYDFINKDSEDKNFKDKTSEAAILKKFNENRRARGAKELTLSEFRKKQVEDEARRRQLEKAGPNVVAMDDYRKQREESDKKANAGKPSQVTNPRSFKDEMSKVDEMAADMAGLKGTEQKLAQDRIEAALAADSEGGASITQKEMEKFRVLLDALNQSEMTKNTKVIADKLDNKAVGGSRRNN